MERYQSGNLGIFTPYPYFSVPFFLDEGNEVVSPEWHCLKHNYLLFTEQARRLRYILDRRHLGGFGARWREAILELATENRAILQPYRQVIGSE